MRIVLAIILTIIILLAPAQQSAPACVIAGADLVASLADAQTTSKCLDIPAGVYTITPSGGQYLSVTADNLEIRGAGIGKTIIATQGITLTSTLTVFMLHGAYQHIHDLTIKIGSGYSGTPGVVGIQAYAEATYPTIERVEISGGYSGDGGANGAGISTYRVWSTPNQFATIQDNYVHDSPAQGMVINSSNNVISHNRIERINGTGLTHGFYIQGGYNLLDGNYVANVSGWSFHAHKAVPNIDGSGDRYTNNTSIDPGQGHLIIDGFATLARNATITDNVFRNTAGHTSNGVSLNVPTLFTDNIVEDVAQVGSSALIIAGLADNSIIRGNRITNATATGGYAISALVASTVEDNAILGTTPGWNGVALNHAGVVARGNRIAVAAASGIVINIDGRIEGNDIAAAGGACLSFGLNGNVKAIIRDNVLTATGGATWISAKAGPVLAIFDRNVQR